MEMMCRGGDRGRLQKHNLQVGLQRIGCEKVRRQKRKMKNISKLENEKDTNIWGCW